MEKPAKTRRIPNLITYIPISISDIIAGTLLTALASSDLIGPCLRFLPTSETSIYIKNLFNVYIPFYSTMTMNTAFTAMLISGLIDRSRNIPIPHKEDVSEKLGVKREEISKEVRKEKIKEICHTISKNYTEDTYPLREEAKTASKTLDELIYKIEGVRIKTSDKVKNSYITKYLMPHALGGYNLVSSDIEIYRQLPYMSFSTVAHELAHRKRYFKENDAELLSHLAGFTTQNPVFMQSSRVSRLRRECQTLFRVYDDLQKKEKKYLKEEYKNFLNGLNLPEKLKNQMIETESKEYNPVIEGLKRGQLAMYKMLMRITRQKEGLKRYTNVFTEDLYALEKGYSSIENLVEHLRSR